jgi:hypothetical protein
MRVRNANKKKASKILKILVTPAQARALGEDWSDVSCPFASRAARRRGRRRKTAGRKK